MKVAALVLIVLGLWSLAAFSTVDAIDPAEPATTTTSKVDAAIIPPLVLEQTTTTAAAPTATVETLPRSHETGPTAPARDAVTTVSSTAYCETGRMANGEVAHDGAVSSKTLRRGSRWQVLTGPFTGRVLTVKDTGPLAFFDIAMPGRCADAVAYGRRAIQISPAP
jgi:hypothetical protein